MHLHIGKRLKLKIPPPDAAPGEEIAEITRVVGGLCFVVPKYSFGRWYNQQELEGMYEELPEEDS